MKTKIIYIFFLVVVSCEKHNDEVEKYLDEIFINKYQAIYGVWISNEICGGYTGGCWDYKNEILKIIKYGKFKLEKENNKFNEGYIEIIKQDEESLIIRFIPKEFNTNLFSYFDLIVIFKEQDKLVLAEGGGDTYSYEFIRSE